MPAAKAILIEVVSQMATCPSLAITFAEGGKATAGTFVLCRAFMTNRFNAEA
jgi:hypothetical protein